jgi:plastocyanin
MYRLAAALLLSVPFAALAAGEPEFRLSIENHRFVPERIEVPAGKKVKLIVENKDASAEEFESHALRVEKVIAGKSKATVFVGPLKAGEYKFVGEFNEKTAKGVLVAN